MKKLQRIDTGRLISRREALKISPSKLARAIGVRPQTIDKIEAGRIYRTRYLQEIASTLGVNPDWLLGKTDDMTPFPVIAEVSAIFADLTEAERDEAMRLLKAWYNIKREKAGSFLL